MLRNASGIRLAQGAAIAASAVVIGALAALPAQTTPTAAPPARPTSIAQMSHALVAPGAFSLEQILSYPYVEEMVASPTEPRFAWVVVRAGVRNVWGASGPEFTPRQLTDYRANDGHELTNLSISSRREGRGLRARRRSQCRLGMPKAGCSPIRTIRPIRRQSAAPGPSRSAMAATAHSRRSCSPTAICRCSRRAGIASSSSRTTSSASSRSMAHRLRSRSSSRAAQSDRPCGHPSGDRLRLRDRRGDHGFIGVFSSDAAPNPVSRPDLDQRHGAGLVTRRQEHRLRAPAGERWCTETLLDLHPDPLGDLDGGRGHRRGPSGVAKPEDAPRLLSRRHPSCLRRRRPPGLLQRHRWLAASLLGSGVRWRTAAAHSRGLHGRVRERDAGHSAVVYNANTGTTAAITIAGICSAFPSIVPRRSRSHRARGLEWNPAISGDGRTVAFIGAGAQRPPLPMLVPARRRRARACCRRARTGIVSHPGARHPQARGVQGGGVGPGMPTDSSSRARAADARAPGTPRRSRGMIFVHGGPPRQCCSAGATWTTARTPTR